MFHLITGSETSKTYNSFMCVCKCVVVVSNYEFLIKTYFCFGKSNLWLFLLNNNFMFGDL